MISKIKLFIFPFFLIIIHEILFMKIIVYSMKDFNYFILIYAFTSMIAGYFSDRFSRKFFLYFSLIICLFIFLFYYLGYMKLVIVLYPFFISSPISRAAVIDNHEHFSIKNLICFLRIVCISPWCFYSFFSTKSSDMFMLIFLIITVISAFFFHEKKREHMGQNIFKKKGIIKKRYVILLFSLAFFLAQIVFFMNLNILKFETHYEKVFNFTGVGFLLGAFFCLFLKGKHDSLLFLTYGFLFLLAANILTSFLFWENQGLSNVLIGEMSIIGGIFDPLITEKMVISFGKNNKGLACSLLESMVSVAVIMAFFISFIFKRNNLQFIIFLLFLVTFICIFQWISNYLSDKIMQKNKGNI